MKIIQGTCVLLFNSIFLVAMDAPVQQPTTLSPDALVKMVVEGKESEPLELPWQQVELSDVLRSMIEDMNYKKAPENLLLPTGVSLDTAKTVFTLLKPYAESSLTNEEDRLKEYLDPQLKKLSLNQLVEIANGANLLSVNQPILNRIGTRCTALITKSPHLMFSDYQAINAMNEDFFMTYLSINPKSIAHDIKILLLKEQLSDKSKISFNINFKPLVGDFYNETSIIIAGINKGQGILRLNDYNDRGKQSVSNDYKIPVDHLFESESMALTENFIAVKLDDKIMIQQRFSEKKVCILEGSRTFEKLIFSPTAKYLIAFSFLNAMAIYDIDSIDWSQQKPIIEPTSERISPEIVTYINEIFFISDTQLFITGKKKMDFKLLQVTISSEKNFLKYNIEKEDTIKSVFSGVDRTAFSRDGNYLLYGYGQYAKHWIVVYDIQKRKVINEFEMKDIKQHEFFSLCFNTDNSLVICGCEYSILMYDAVSGDLLHTFLGLQRNTTIKFNSFDKNFIAIQTPVWPIIAPRAIRNKYFPEKGVIWKTMTDQQYTALKLIKKYHQQDKLTFLYRFLFFLQNKKNMEFKEGDENQFYSLHNEVRRLLEYIKQSSQEKKPAYQKPVYRQTWQEKWQQWKNSFLTPARKAMIFYGTLATGATAMGYALYKYMTSTSTTTKD